MGGTIRNRNDHDHISIMAVRAESLGTAQYPMIALAMSHHASAACVGTRRGLGQTPGADVLSGGEFGHIFLPLLIIACKENMIGTERSMSRDDNSERTIHSRE